jgi:hypothetical protein
MGRIRGGEFVSWHIKIFGGGNIGDGEVTWLSSGAEAGIMW